MHKPSLLALGKSASVNVSVDFGLLVGYDTSCFTKLWWENWFWGLKWLNYSLSHIKTGIFLICCVSDHSRTPQMYLLTPWTVKHSLLGHFFTSWYLAERYNTATVSMLSYSFQTLDSMCLLLWQLHTLQLTVWWCWSRHTFSHGRKNDSPWQ